MTFQQPAESIRRRYDAGTKLRERIPRARQAQWDARPDRDDPLTTIASVNQGRVASLQSEKYRRMQRSPFAFFRGAAVLMASDLATLPSTGLTAQLCGDAHVFNLGAYAAPDGQLVFDINDFDETTPGPWEWDVKRLATSLVLAGQDCGQSESRCMESVRAMVASYRQHLREFARMPFAALGRHLIARRRGADVLDRIFQDAERVTPDRTLEKLATRVRGRFRFHDKPPDLEHVSTRTATDVAMALKGYAMTLTASRRRTFGRYRPADVAFKRVGTGSVGTRDYVVLLFGNDAKDPLFIQVKQQLPSCCAPYLPAPRPRFTHHGRRVAEGQMMMQTASDPFLGYTRCGGHDYLVRQLADHKAGVEPTALKRGVLLDYARLCGEVLAKGHARTTDAATLAGYVGGSSKLDRAIAAFAVAYAEQSTRDYRHFVTSLRGGRSDDQA
jgi:uncharacterized protein (DUF2252 family)